MAMIKCTECGKEMSDRAAVCPNCGCPIEEIKSRLSEIASEQEEKLKVKEEERKAKELADEVKRQKKEEARKAVTPQMKMKRLIIGVVVALLAVGIGICGWYFGIKVPRDAAYQAYLTELDNCNAVISEYNTSIEQYNDKAKLVIGVNTEFDELINSAQALVDCRDTPYEGAKVTSLSNSIKDARNNKIDNPELVEKVNSVSLDSNLEKAGKSDIDATISELEDKVLLYKNLIQENKAATDNIELPDYSIYVETLTTQSKELEDSYAIVRQITAPSEEWVITRLGRVSDVANMAPVTEENDPNGNLNKPGGYTSTVYFGTSLLSTQDLTGNALIDEGTDAGGAIETYKTAEEAEKRNNYLASFDGAGFLSSGSHEVLGTMVVRTSDDLKASQQETLTNAIIAEMIKLD